MSGLLETLQKVCSNAGSVKNCSVVLVLFCFVFLTDPLPKHFICFISVVLSIIFHALSAALLSHLSLFFQSIPLVCDFLKTLIVDGFFPPSRILTCNFYYVVTTAEQEAI